MKYLVVILALGLTACAGAPDENPYRTLVSGDQTITYLKDEYRTNDPFPITFNGVQCLFWLSGTHNDGFNRSAQSYAISNCQGEAATQAGSYEHEGTGLVLCSNDVECRTYTERR